jgi:hypothetical protein
MGAMAAAMAAEEAMEEAAPAKRAKATTADFDVSEDEA